MTSQQHGVPEISYPLFLTFPRGCGIPLRVLSCQSHTEILSHVSTC